MFSASTIDTMTRLNKWKFDGSTGYKQSAVVWQSMWKFQKIRGPCLTNVSTF
jgi:hypothetical protein